LDEQLEKINQDVSIEQGDYTSVIRGHAELATPLSEKKTWFSFDLNLRTLFQIAMVLLGLGFIGFIVSVVWHRVQGEHDFTIHQNQQKSKSRFLK
jgi:hypothetical protein